MVLASCAAPLMTGSPEGAWPAPWPFSCRKFSIFAPLAPKTLGGLLTVGSSLRQSADSTQQPDIPCYSPLRSSGRETSSRTAFQILAGSWVAFPVDLGLLSLLRQFQYAVIAANVRCSERRELPLKPIGNVGQTTGPARPERHLGQISLLFSLLAGK